MKTTITLIFSSLILLLVTGSCTLEKRVYSKGYHVHWKTPSYASHKTEKREINKRQLLAASTNSQLIPFETNSTDTELLAKHYKKSTFNPKALDALSIDNQLVLKSKTDVTRGSSYSRPTTNTHFPFPFFKSQKPWSISFAPEEIQEQSDDPTKDTKKRMGPLGLLSLVVAWGLFLMAVILAFMEVGGLVTVFVVAGVVFYAFALVLGFIAVFDPADDLDLIFGILTILASLLPLLVLL